MPMLSLFDECALGKTVSAKMLLTGNLSKTEHFLSFLKKFKKNCNKTALFPSYIIEGLFLAFDFAFITLLRSWSSFTMASFFLSQKRKRVLSW
jgi:hypothetical protein